MQLSCTPSCIFIIIFRIFFYISSNTYNFLVEQLLKKLLYTREKKTVYAYVSVVSAPPPYSCSSPIQTCLTIQLITWQGLLSNIVKMGVQVLKFF